MNDKLDERVKVSLEFTDSLRKFFDGTLPTYFDEVLQEDDLELFETDEPLLTFEGQDVIVNDKKVKAKIAEVILENRINDRLFEMEFEKSAKIRDIVGYY